MNSYDLSQLVAKVFKLETRLTSVEDQIRLLPTKDEFFTWMDKLYGELQTMRNENIFRDQRLGRIEEKLTSIQKLV